MVSSNIRKAISGFAIDNFLLGAHAQKTGIEKGGALYLLEDEESLSFLNQVDTSRLELISSINMHNMNTMLCALGYSTEQISEETIAFNRSWANANIKDVPSPRSDMGDYLLGVQVDYYTKLVGHFSKWDEYQRMDWDQKIIPRKSFDYVPGDRPREGWASKLMNIFRGKHLYQ